MLALVFFYVNCQYCLGFLVLKQRTSFSHLPDTALQLIVLGVFGAVDHPLAFCMLFHFLEIGFKWRLVCKFDIMEYTFLLFLVLFMLKFFHILCLNFFIYLNISQYNLTMYFVSNSHVSNSGHVLPYSAFHRRSFDEFYYVVVSVTLGNVLHPWKALQRFAIYIHHGGASIIHYRDLKFVIFLKIRNGKDHVNGKWKYKLLQSTQIQLGILCTSNNLIMHMCCTQTTSLWALWDVAKAITGL